MRRKSSRILRNNRGTSTTEYALLASIFSLAMCVITPGIDGAISGSLYRLPFVNGMPDEGRLNGNGDGFGTIRMPPPGFGDGESSGFGEGRLHDIGGTRGTQPGGGIIHSPNRPDGDSNSGGGSSTDDGKKSDNQTR